MTASKSLQAWMIAACGITLFGIVEQIRFKDSIIFPLARKMSTVLYFIHLYVWTFYYMAVYGQKTGGMDIFLAVTGICIIIALLYIVIKDNIKQKNWNLQKHP